MTKKALIIFISIVVLAGLVGGGAALVKNRGNNKEKQSNVIDQKKNAPIQTSRQAAQNNQPAQNVPVSTTLSVSNVQASEQGNVVSATASIGGSKDASSDCVFTFSNDLAKPVVRQVTPSGTAPNLTCSATINNVEFSVVGSWKLTVNYYNNGEQANGTTDVTIN
ncbi:MAG TPA: hypothetical protein VLG92_00935 [Candidatus Saccharimonadia bacterium]|nr:hypothetical protein [Candidatus Saccharimonadia bacterium]